MLATSSLVAAKLLKDLGVPARDTQVILGHTHVSTTQQIYTT
jgi:integrase